MSIIAIFAKVEMTASIILFSKNERCNSLRIYTCSRGPVACQVVTNLVVFFSV